MDPQQQALVEELETWRNLGHVLWPHFRYVGLFSGNAQLASAAKQLADLLGITEETLVQASEDRAAHNAALDEVIKMYREFYYRQMLTRHSENFLREVEKLKK